MSQSGPLSSSSGSSGSGEFIQQVRSSLTEYLVIGTTMPLGDTIPTTADGTQIFSLAITPTSSSSILRIQANISIWNAATASNLISYALFDGGTDAIASSMVVDSGSADAWMLTMDYFMTAGTTSQIIFTIRAGGINPPININGAFGSRWGGGTLTSTMYITEMAT